MDEDLTVLCHGKEKCALTALIKIYGNDANEILNAVFHIAARIAIGGGVEPEEYVAGVKYHWDLLANELNRSTMQ